MRYYETMDTIHAWERIFAQLESTRKNVKELKAISQECADNVAA